MELTAIKVDSICKTYILNCIDHLYTKSFKTLFEAHEYAIDFYGSKILIENADLSNTIKYSTDFPSHFKLEQFLINTFNDCEVKYDRHRYNSISLYKGVDRMFVFDYKSKHLGCDYNYVWSVLLYQYNCGYFDNSHNPNIHKVISEFVEKYLGITNFKPMSVQSWDNSI